MSRDFQFGFTPSEGASMDETWSEWWDSNSRPSAPKADALTRLRYIPKLGSPAWDRTTDTLINSQVQLPLCY